MNSGLSWSLAKQARSFAQPDRVFRTPSAVTRKLQRLENLLGAELLDRSVKPPRLAPLGIRILEQGRELLQRVDEMKAYASGKGVPRGPFKLGLAQALADAGIASAIGGIPERFGGVTVKVVSDVTPKLLDWLILGELDAGLVLLPAGKAVPPSLSSTIVASDVMVPVIARSATKDKVTTIADLAKYSWVLNPPGCLLRTSLIDELEASGVPAMVAAEVHNPHVQLALVASGLGIGLLPSRFVRRHAQAGEVVVLRLRLHLGMDILLVRGGALGSLDVVLEHLRSKLADLQR